MLIEDSMSRRILFVLVLSILSPVLVLAQNVSVLASKNGDAEHFEFYGKEQWDYDVKKTDEGYELIIADMTDDSLKKLLSFKGQFVTQIQADKTTVDGKRPVRFFVNKNTEVFDYLTDQPSRLIIDFYAKESTQKKAKVTAAPLINFDTTDKNVKAKVKTSTKVGTQIKSKDQQQRKPASDEFVMEEPPQEGLTDNSKNSSNPQMSEKEKQLIKGIFDGADPNLTRFQMNDYEMNESNIIKSKANIYIAFPTLSPEYNHLNDIHANWPLYQIIPAALKENKEARLLQVLFEKERTATFLKTLEWFRERFPTSQYNELLDFMEADVYYKLWLKEGELKQFEMAMLKYRRAVASYPDSKLVERTIILMGFATLKRKDSLGAIRIFQEYIKNNPKGPNKDVAQIAIARAYMQLNKYEEALLNLDLVEKNAFKKEAKVEASFLKGDVNYLSANYAQAIKEYQNSINKYSDSVALYPNALFNQAESLFWLKDYKKSLDAHLEFLKKFPDHTYAGFSITRVGETLEILGANEDKVLGAYLEAQFRYGQSPNAIVARIRLARLRMPKMKVTELETTIKDLLKTAETETLPKLYEFTLIEITDALSQRGDNERAVEMLAQYYQQNPTRVDQNTFKDRIVNYINNEIENLIDDGKFIAALQVHNKYEKSWLKYSERIDTNYFLGQAFEQAGVYKSAEKEYVSTYNKILALKDTRGGKEKSVFEKLPKLEVLNLRIASVMVQNNKWQEAYDYFKQIKNSDLLSQDQEIERVYLGSKILQKKGDYKTAQTYLLELLKEWSGQPIKAAPLYYELADIELKSKNADEAIRSLEKILELTQENPSLNEELQMNTLTKLSDLYLDKNDNAKSIETLNSLLEKFDEKKPLDSYRYKLGELYFKSGDLKSANNAWNVLANRENTFWYKLAQEKLKNSDWNQNYKKYIQRVPASANKEVQ